MSRVSLSVIPQRAEPSRFTRRVKIAPEQRFIHRVNEELVALAQVLGRVQETEGDLLFPEARLQLAHPKLPSTVVGRASQQCCIKSVDFLAEVLNGITNALDHD